MSVRSYDKDMMNGKKKTTRKPYYNSDGTHSPTSGYVWRPGNADLTKRGYPSSRNPTSQPTVKTSTTTKTYVNPRMKRESTPSSKPAATGGRAAHEGMIPKPTATNTTTGKKNSRPQSANKSGNDVTITKTTSAKPTTPTKKNSRPQKAIKGWDDIEQTTLGRSWGLQELERSNKKNSRPQSANKSGNDLIQTSLGNPKGLRDLEKSSKTNSRPQRAIKSGNDIVQTSLGNPKGLHDLEKSTKRNSRPQSANKSGNDIEQTSLGNPKGLRDLEKRNSKSGVSSASAKQTGKSGTNPTSDNTRDIIAQGFTEVKTPTAKKRWNEKEVLKERREAAKAQGKGNWNAEEEMKKRREAAKAQGKGNWNAEEEMRKRREAAAAKKKGGRV